MQQPREIINEIQKGLRAWRCWPNGNCPWPAISGVRPRPFFTHCRTGTTLPAVMEIKANPNHDSPTWSGPSEARGYCGVDSCFGVADWRSRSHSLRSRSTSAFC